MKFFTSILLILFTLTASCFSPQDKNRDKNIHLKDAAPFKIGVAIDPTLYNTNKSYKVIVNEEFNSITPENFMKMNRLAPQQNSYNWTAADGMVNTLIKQNKRIHGHALIWHTALPDWVNNFKGNKNDWDNLMKKYINDVVSHFKGKVSSWDVVNEAFESDGSFRKNIWFQHLGEEYIEKAFVYAHQADPQAKLFYNDFWQERKEKKRDSIKEYMIKLIKKKIPIDGVGLQMHTDVSISNENILSALQSMSETGLLVHISELTIIVNTVDKKNMNFIQNDSLNYKQMQKFADIFSIYQQIVPKPQQYGITLWNVGDADSYFPKQCKCKDYPQIFDTNYKKKDYFYKIIDALKKTN